jgi:hypothetical protein
MSEISLSKEDMNKFCFFLREKSSPLLKRKNVIEP